MNWESILKNEKRFEVRLYDEMYASRKKKIPYRVLRYFSNKEKAEEYVSTLPADDDDMQYYAVVEV